MEADEGASKAHGGKDIDEKEDIDDKVAHLGRQLKLGECDDDLYEGQEGE